jgi:nicotinate-nucleotide pyrophosphorylase (carboxylating)
MISLFSSFAVQSLIELALTEDCSLGDVTSECCEGLSGEVEASLLYKEDGVVCGIPILQALRDALREEWLIRPTVEEGTLVARGTVAAVIKGETRSLLMAERTLLNFVQRLSGVATYTRSIVALAEGMPILDTRKTLPGWRMLDKYATKIGGAINHRMSLGDLILIKNNHIDAARANGVSLVQLVTQVCVKRRFGVAVECEVRSIEELTAVIECPIDYVLLDNMTTAQIEEAVRFVQEKAPRIRIEASGNMNAERIKELCHIKGLSVSLGSLTNKAPALDISLRF